MDYPIIPNEMLIELIDNNRELAWSISDRAYIARLIKDSSLLELGTRLIRISVRKGTEHYQVASPIFTTGTNAAIVVTRLERLSSGEFQPPAISRSFHLTYLCESHRGKNCRRAWPATVRWLIVDRLPLDDLTLRDTLALPLR